MNPRATLTPGTINGIKDKDKNVRLNLKEVFAMRYAPGKPRTMVTIVDTMACLNVKDKRFRLYALVIPCQNAPGEKKRMNIEDIGR